MCVLFPTLHARALSEATLTLGSLFDSYFHSCLFSRFQGLTHIIPLQRYLHFENENK